MSRRLLSMLLAAFTLVALSCSELERPAPLAPAGAESASAIDAESLAWALVGEAGWEPAISRDPAKAIPSDGAGELLWSFSREVISGNIVHYSAIVRTGPGPYDQIGVHRVVKESRPFRPIHTRKALFLLHGDLKDFEGMWLPGQFSPNLPDDFGLAAYLAQERIDVWGITQAWNFVPADVTDYSFYADWGLQKEMDHLSIALGIARLSRWISGDGLDKMLLLGYSSGGFTGYSLLNEESQRPAALRQVKGFIAADAGVRSDDPAWLEMGAGFLGFYQGLYDAGEYADVLILRDAALLAKNDPDGDSPFFPGLTNLQLALFYAGGPIFAPSEAHYHAPVLEDDFPVDLQFVTIPQWLDFLENTAASEPMLFEAEYSVLLAGLDSPYVAHLGDITVPVLDIGGGGGIAPYTAATVGYLGSSDITQLYVSTNPERMLDYGHIDIFTGPNAPELVWEPIRDWVVAHSPAGREPVEAFAAMAE